jgi:hypothetical protein
MKIDVPDRHTDPLDTRDSATLTVAWVLAHG